MKHANKPYLLALAAAATALACAAAAQAAPARDAEARAAVAQQPQASTRPAPVLRATQIMGAGVRDAQGQDVGRMDDMVVDTRTGEVRYNVLRVDAAPGLRYAVPAEKLRAYGEGQLVLDAGRKRLARSAIPATAAGDCLRDRERIERLDRQWGRDGPAPAQPLACASELVGRELRSATTGEKVGTVDDLVVDAARHRVQYAVVTFHHDWLGTDKRAAVQLDMLRGGRGADHLLMDVDPARAIEMRSVRDAQGPEQGTS